MVDDSPPRLGDLVKMKIDEDRGLAGVIHKVRTLNDPKQAFTSQPIAPALEPAKYKAKLRDDSS